MNRRAWLIGMLVVSLAINLLFAGIVAGRMVFPAAHLGWMMQELDDETRRSLRESFREHRRDSGAARSDLKTAQQHLHDLIGRTEFHEPAVISALAEVRSASTDYQAIMHQQMVKTLGQMKPEDRLKVYRFLSSRGEGPGRRPPHGRPPP
jgi:uncharacterized membrane protein